MMERKSATAWLKAHRFEIFLVTAALLVHLYVALSPPASLLNWYSNDDAYYYFKVAQNVGDGLGSTFDGINLTNGYHPLWLLICVPVFYLAEIDLLLPLRVLVILSALISSLTGIFIYRLVASRLSAAVGMFAAVFWVFYSGISNIVTTGGMESGISSLFLAWLLYRMGCIDHKNTRKWFNTRLFVTGLIAVLAIMSRLDNIFPAVMAGLWLVFEKDKGRTLLVLDIAAIPVILISSYFLRLGGAQGFFFYAQSAYWFIAILLVVKVPVYYLLGYYHPNRGTIKSSAVKLLLALSLPAVSGFVLLSLLQTAGVISSFPRTIVLVDVGLTLAWLVVTRLLPWRKISMTTTAFTIEAVTRQQLTEKITRAVSYALPNAVILAIYVTVNKIVFDTFTPVSGQVKHWWSTLVNPIYGRVASNFGEMIGFPAKSDTSWSLFLNGVRLVSLKLVDWFEVQTRTGRLVMDLLVLLILLLLIFLILRRNLAYWMEQANHLGLPPLFAASLLHVLYYGAGGYIHTRSWYWIIQLLLGILFMSVFIDAIYFNISNKSGARSAKILLAAAGVALITSFCVRTIEYYPYNVAGRSENIFELQARSLEEITEEGALIGTTGGGGLSYFIEGRTIVNLDGLMNSKEYFDLLKSGNADQLLNRIGLDYVYEKKYVVEESDPYRTFLPGYLERLDRVNNIPLYRYTP